MTDALQCVTKVVSGLDPFLGAFGAVVDLISLIKATRPKVHKERVQRLKNRISALEEQLRSVGGSVSDSAQLQHTRSRLEKVLEETLTLLRKLEDMGWIKRLCKGSLDGDFDELNQRLSQESLSLVLSLNIDARAMQQTFNTDRRAKEDESDRLKDMKYLEEILHSTKETNEMVKETKEMVKDTHLMVKEIKTGLGSPPVSPIKELTTPPLTQAPPPSYGSLTQPPQQAPPYTQAPPQVSQPAQHYTQAPPQVYQPAQNQVQHQMTQQHQMVQQQMAQQPQIVICSGDLGDVPTMTTCRNCGHRVQTRVVYHSGAFAWFICGFCVLFGLVFGCCVIPFFMDSCKDAHHFCTNCNANLCVHKRM